MDTYILLGLFAVSIAVSAGSCLAAGGLHLIIRRRGLRAVGCNCELTLLEDYLRQDCRVHGWQPETEARRSRTSLTDRAYSQKPTHRREVARRSAVRRSEILARVTVRTLARRMQK